MHQRVERQQFELVVRLFAWLDTAGSLPDLELQSAGIVEPRAVREVFAQRGKDLERFGGTTSLV